MIASHLWFPNLEKEDGNSSFRDHSLGKMRHPFIHSKVLAS